MVESFKDTVKAKMDAFVRSVFIATKVFPREEIYITTAQLKRAALSIILNYIEGFARFNRGNQLQFLRTSYGSLKEVEYLLYFSVKQGFLGQKQSDALAKELDQIGAMLWTELTALSKSINE